MSVKVMTHVWDQCPQQGEALLVMLAMADWCNDEGECHPSVPKLATKARITVRSVYRVLNKLEADGEIEIEVGGGRGKTSVYRLRKYAAALKNEPRRNGDDMSGYAGKGDAVSRKAGAETLTAVHENPDSGDTSPPHPPYKELTINEPSGKRRVARKRTVNPEDRHGPFADVWHALARIRRLNPDVCSDVDRANLRRLASTITRSGVTDPDTVIAWGRQWYATMARQLKRQPTEIDPPSVRQLTTFMGARLPRRSVDASQPTALTADTIRERWPGLTFQRDGRLRVKGINTLAAEGYVERDSYVFHDRSTWPADVRECLAAVEALNASAVLS